MENNKFYSCCWESAENQSLYQNFGDQLSYKKIEIHSTNIDGEWQNFVTVFLIRKTEWEKKLVFFMKISLEWTSELWGCKIYHQFDFRGSRQKY